ncbi:NUDIX hydrolase [Granulicella sibirica]|uniref:NUDIX hydrolase n=1 Tax=Granulicella sibirica TaxID=2479048 RepID=UPI001F4F22DF|nr:NUDIX hydrolase N-terminal domain-containing protein [Granulicella sibirica]
MLTQRLQALAQAGLAYSTNAFDLERYEEIRGLSVRLLGEITDEPYEKIVQVFASETGYQTPKVDIRAVIFRGDSEILMVRETNDGGRWTLPGGWADVGYTPFETAEKEALEETGLIVKAVRLLALLDKRKHEHPAQPWYIYKAFIRCEMVGGELLQETAETGGARWFTLAEALGAELSVDRVTASQLELMFRFVEDPGMAVVCD